MDKDQVIAKLREHETELRAAGAERMSIFGSVARGEATEDFDIDLSKGSLTRIRDILENGSAALAYTKGMDFEAYMGNGLVRDATERCFTRIAEAGAKLGSLAVELFPNHDWLAMRHLGNVLCHDYDGVLDETIWSMITDRLPPLIVELETFLAQYPEDQETL
ncbi:HepT-like ribonuclease domain-containing protein [Aliirhizobium smilacinae]|uniref:DUF86 domain-containing protein n=1 Tax=Aliirhizobium smilacinae TaxID=1395944 RepID=A0A5C4XQY4_9HYPH|nr:HepT-like ribonuclease domain-containing protein [Rhizobium smilacinae]TNM65905.1 DUF86 domain-containing protein [Rhizobium smilacinae]